MPHEHGHCHDEAEHDHDHEDHETEGQSDNLYTYIDHDNVTGLNLNEDTIVSNAIKPWHLRMDESQWIESDADDQMIVRIPFTGSVKLRSVLIKSGPGDQTPVRVVLFANEDNLDFSDISERQHTQEFVVPQARDVGEYTVKASKFASLSSLTLFFPASQGAETTRIYYVGLRGTWSERKREPVITVYEARANLADHEKIPGLDGTGSHLGN